MRHLFLTAALGATLSATALANPTGRANGVSGDYVEARTASVFAGACHYNGEIVTTGRDAIMAWNIKEGAWNGVSLDGVKAMAAVSSEANLKDPKAARRTVLYVDEKATEAQSQAMTDALKAEYGTVLGKLITVKRVAVSFESIKNGFRAEAKGAGKIAIKAMPNAECCKMPNMVCYEPLIALKNRKVGFTQESGVSEKTLKALWTKGNDNTAFYGAFKF